MGQLDLEQLDRGLTRVLCAGIRQLQLVLLKVALLLGAEVHVNVEFRQLLEPPEDEPRNSEDRLLSGSDPV